MTSQNGFTFNFRVFEDEDVTTASVKSWNKPKDSDSSGDQEEEMEIGFKILTDIPNLLKIISEQRIDSKVVLRSHIGDEEECLSRICSPEQNSVIYEHVEKNFDIVPGKYEGGLKLWECSLDLCRYISNQISQLKPKYVMEIGCGHGLPGCLILKNALKDKTNAKVFFTDFNDFVLKDVTLANILLNTKNYKSNEVLDSIVIGAGDWDKMSTEILAAPATAGIPSTGRFDLLLAAETTYTTKTAIATARILATHLDPNCGIGLVATKRYYFGCGGGVEAFHNAASSQQVKINGTLYRLDIRTLEIFDNGTGNIRELLQVVLKEAA